MLYRILLLLAVTGVLFLFWAGAAIEIIAVAAVLYSAGIGGWIIGVCSLGMYVQALACYLYMKDLLTRRFFSW